MRLKNKICAITGAGSGIGEAAAKQFAAEGANVILLEIDANAAERVAEEIGPAATAIPVDLADANAVAGVFTRIAETHGALHGLYNNASIFLGDADGPVVDLDLDTYHRILGSNLHAVVHCCKYAIPLMVRSRGGAIVNTSSSAAISGVSGCDAYTISKGAVMALTRSLAVTYAPHGVRANCIAPAGIHTPMIRQSNLNDPAFDESAFLAKTPIRRWGRPDEIAQTALFLTSEESSYINGAVIVADGGITITPMF